ncbi:hypothetical protein Acr_17g0013240 [Actinidia rufa]|uniref:Uncharacterized protein n=1 Tax=Actinidia rufa TaxID=165716 RepID=A0A7J0G4T6_9ERIC|nr:hypothetical protein Acr_17g0013240 [Actinidia rufa]
MSEMTADGSEGAVEPSEEGAQRAWIMAGKAKAAGRKVEVGKGRTTAVGWVSISGLRR